MFLSLIIKLLYWALSPVSVKFKANAVSAAPSSSAICYKKRKYDIRLGPLELVSITEPVLTEYDSSAFYT
jgi:hypothetical protein